MIKIMLDSASDCRPNDSFCDYFVPINVNMCGKDYLSGVTLDSDTFYTLLTGSKEFPKTAQPSPQNYVEFFEEIKNNGDELICLCLSSELSGTYQSACLAKGMVDYEGIYVIDTLNATHMIRYLAEYAAKLVQEGLSAAEIAEKCEAIKGRIRVFAGVDTLEYLYRGGRLSRASAAIGDLTGIKPILTVEAGKVENVGKALGRARAIQFIMKQLEGSEIDGDFPMYSLYTYGDENILNLEKHLNMKHYPIAGRLQIGPAIGAHLGPGVYGVCWVEKQ